MNRKEMINFINTEILPTAEIDFYDWKYSGRQIIADMINAISKWRIGKPANVEMSARVIDGVLYINGESVKRVAAKLPRWDSMSAPDYEGRILARQESEYD